MTEERGWTDEERRALRGLGEEAGLPPGLEGRIVDAAADRDLVRGEGERAPRRRPWGRAALAAAAAVALFLGGAWLGPELGGPGAPAGAERPRFLFLLHEGPGFDASGDVAGEYVRWVIRMRGAGRAVDGEELSPAERVAGADSAAAGGSGPGRPTGYFVVEARDLEEAEEIAREHPHVRRGGTIEVRPIVDRPGGS